MIINENSKTFKFYMFLKNWESTNKYGGVISKIRYQYIKNNLDVCSFFGYILIGIIRLFSVLFMLLILPITIIAFLSIHLGFWKLFLSMLSLVLGLSIFIGFALLIGVIIEGIDNRNQNKQNNGLVASRWRDFKRKTCTKIEVI